MRAAASLALVALLAVAAGCTRRDRDEAPAAPSDQAAAPSQAAPKGAAALPRRKPGLWEMSMSVQGEDMPPVVTRVCLDEATEARMPVWGGQVMRDMCEKNLVTPRTDGSVQFSSVCDMGSGGKVTSSGVVTGDLTSNYVVRVQSSTTGAQVPQMNRQTSYTIASRRVGDCAEGQRGGDMVMPGGVTVNMNDTMGSGR